MYAHGSHFKIFINNLSTQIIVKIFAAYDKQLANIIM